MLESPSGFEPGTTGWVFSALQDKKRWMILYPKNGYLKPQDIRTFQDRHTAKRVTVYQSRTLNDVH